MADAPRTSFIPKQNTAPKSRMPAPKRKRTFNIFNFAVFVVFLATVLAAGIVFFLEQRAQTSLDQSKAALNEIENTFSRSDIESIRELNQRINVADSILRQHLSPTLVFDMLERRTQNEVQFNSFLYERAPSGNVVMALDGVAPRFNTVALQSQEFTDESAITRAFFTNMNVVFENPQTGEGERVQFRVTSSVNTDVIAYTADPRDDSIDSEETDMATTTDATSTPETSGEVVETNQDDA